MWKLHLSVYIHQMPCWVSAIITITKKHSLTAQQMFAFSSNSRSRFFRTTQCDFFAVTLNTVEKAIQKLESNRGVCNMAKKSSLARKWRRRRLARRFRGRSFLKTHPRCKNTLERVLPSLRASLGENEKFCKVPTEICQKASRLPSEAR